MPDIRIVFDSTTLYFLSIQKYQKDLLNTYKWLLNLKIPQNSNILLERHKKTKEIKCQHSHQLIARIMKIILNVSWKLQQSKDTVFACAHQRVTVYIRTSVRILVHQKVLLAWSTNIFERLTKPTSTEPCVNIWTVCSLVEVNKAYASRGTKAIIL